ncbi:MAG TPA: hypothetical protein VJ731_07345, partial [Terriglobales bacterium]|nr:hypothetical protein [Terriglobales bacterium]
MSKRSDAGNASRSIDGRLDMNSSYNLRMTQPSKAGAVFLFLFGLPFFGFGLFAAWAFLTSSPAVHKNDNPIFGAVFASVFALIGAGLMSGAILGYRKQQQQAAIEQANPDSPWLWKPDWASSKALSEKRNSVYGWWIGAAFASMIAFPIVIGNLPQLLRNSDPKALILIGFCLIPLILLIGAVRATIRRERYGKTYFEFSSLPFSPGKHLAGQIHLRLNTAADHGVDLRLSCIRRIVTGSGKQQTTNNIVLWKDEKNVPQTALTIGPLGNAIPVDFGIPQDAYETNHDNLRDQLLWMLHARADVPGVDYSDDFEVPVFGSGASRAPVSGSEANFATGFGSSFGSVAGSAATGTAPAFEADATEVTAPANPKVAISVTQDGSTQFLFPAFRNPAQTLVLLVVTSVWSGVVYFLAYSRAPWFFAAVFGLFDLLLVYGCFQSVFGSTRIIVGNGKITSLRKIFGVGTPREVLFGDIQSVVAAMGLQSSNGNQANYSIRLQKKDGKKFSLADNITDRQEARWIVSQIEKLAGLKIDTHVALQGPFGNAYAPPPQRVFSGNVSVASKPKRNVAAGLIGFSMFLAWTGFLVYKFIGSQHTVVQRRSSPANAASQA